MTTRSQTTQGQSPGIAPIVPIRVSLAHRVRSLMRIVAPSLMFLLVLLLIGWIWSRELHPTHFVGRANRIEALVVTPDDGMISNMWFRLHDEVKAGAAVIDVVTTDPRTVSSRLAVMRGRMDLTRLEMSPVLNQQRNSLDYAQLAIQTKRLKADIVTDKVELEHEKLQLKRAQQMYKDRLISEESLDTEMKKVESSETSIAEKQEVYSDMVKTLDQLSFLSKPYVPDGENDPLKRALELQASQTKAYQEKIAPLKVISPLDGVITVIYHTPGENVLAGEPILRVLAKKPDRIVAQMPVTCKVDPQMGMSVRVTTQGHPRQEGWGEVMGVNPGYNSNTNVTQQPAVPLTYLELSVSIPPNLNLKPGQPVDLFFESRGGAAGEMSHGSSTSALFQGDKRGL